MAKRKDGQERKVLLLESATKVFAEKGFRDTTIADICENAHSNMASVNYYYGSKDELYAEVWKKAFHEAIEKYPPDMQLEKDITNGTGQSYRNYRTYQTGCNRTTSKKDDFNFAGIIR